MLPTQRFTSTPNVYISPAAVPEDLISLVRGFFTRYIRSKIRSWFVQFLLVNLTQTELQIQCGDAKFFICGEWSNEWMHEWTICVKRKLLITDRLWWAFYERLCYEIPGFWHMKRSQVNSISVNSIMCFEGTGHLCFRMWKRGFAFLSPWKIRIGFLQSTCELGGS